MRRKLLVARFKLIACLNYNSYLLIVKQLDKRQLTAENGVIDDVVT